VGGRGPLVGRAEGANHRHCMAMIGKSCSARATTLALDFYGSLYHIMHRGGGYCSCDNYRNCETTIIIMIVIMSYLGEGARTMVWRVRGTGARSSGGWKTGTSPATVTSGRRKCISAAAPARLAQSAAARAARWCIRHDNAVIITSIIIMELQLELEFITVIGTPARLAQSASAR
jgi:hypothetical protein